MQKIKERIKSNFSYIKQMTYHLTTGLLSALGVFLTIFPISTLNFSFSQRIFLILGIILFALAMATVNAFMKKQIIVENYDHKRLIVSYGNLMRIAFGMDNKRKIVVIPVNRCFDTIVDDKLIASGSVHGQWVRECLLDGISLQELDEKIEQTLKNTDYECLTRDQKKLGKLKRYPAGTIAEIKGNHNTIFYLVGLTWLDENLTAHCNRQEYLRCLQCLVDHYDKYGHITPIYMPTMGCSLARVNISLHEAVEALLMIWRINKEKIQEDIHIVIYEKQKTVLAISDFLMLIK